MPIERKLAAIMFTDIAGYTEQMSQDEDKAFALIQKKRELLLPLIEQYEGSKLAGNSDLWNDANLENNPEFGTSGFDALPAGYRTGGGYDTGLGTLGNFWSSSETASATAWYRTLYYGYSSVAHWDDYGKQGGFSVRCLGD